MRLLAACCWFVALGAGPSAAQFREVKVWFTGTGCASCTESMPDRMRRLRGVESASVNAQEGTLELRLAASNRVRIEQVRDLIQQDGTKATRARVKVRGELAMENGRWLLKPAGVSSTYEVRGKDLAAGEVTVAGEITRLDGGGAALQIEASEVAKER